jgi:hypothetical protein
MKEIELTQGKVAFVDDEDFETLSKAKWCCFKNGNTFYSHRRINRKLLSMHHAIMGKPLIGLMVDHIDGNGLNNQKGNLRFVTKRQNCLNRHVKKSSQYPGVYFHKCRAEWMARICNNYKHKYIGSYATEEEAYAAYRHVVEGMGEVLLG